MRDCGVMRGISHKYAEHTGQMCQTEDTTKRNDAGVLLVCNNG